MLQKFSNSFAPTHLLQLICSNSASHLLKFICSKMQQLLELSEAFTPHQGIPTSRDRYQFRRTLHAPRCPSFSARSCARPGDHVAALLKHLEERAAHAPKPGDFIVVEWHQAEPYDFVVPSSFSFTSGVSSVWLLSNRLVSRGLAPASITSAQNGCCKCPSIRYSPMLLAKLKSLSGQESHKN